MKKERTRADFAVLPSLAVASEQEKNSLYRLTARERGWYGNYPRFATNKDILQASRDGKLQHVGADDNILLVGKMRNPELFASFPPYLLPHSVVALKAIGKLWRSELKLAGVDEPNVRLSVTSLTRSEQVQQQLFADPTKLASPDSFHCVGADFDIDASGYYYLTENGPAPVVDPRRDTEVMRKNGEILADRVSLGYVPPTANVPYDPQITNMLVAVTNSLHEAGIINRIVEYQDNATGNRCVHISPSPDFKMS